MTDRVIPVSSSQLAATVAAASFAQCDATVVGYGFMGKHYFQALQALGFGQVNVCSRSLEPLGNLDGIDGVNAKAGGYKNAVGPASKDSLAIVATPTVDLVDATKHLADLGFRKILVEKPVSLESAEISELADHLGSLGVEAKVGYNRLAYPSLVEARYQAHQNGGFTSCSYTATELVRSDWNELYTTEELARWGIANTLHVIGMAHGLIGLPSKWNSTRSGSMLWHSSGSIFVGSGISELGIPFSYNADWKSKGRWSVDLHTDGASYRLCPLEKLFVKTDALTEWQEMPVTAFDGQLKAGVAEQIAAMVSPDVRRILPLISIRETVKLTEFGESVFGYSSSRCSD